MPGRILFAMALVAPLLAVGACGGGGGGKMSTSTKAATKTTTTATRQLTATSTAAQTTASPAVTQAAGQPSSTPVPTERPATQATTTPRPSGSQTIGVSLKEFSVSPSSGSASAGTVTFNVSNDGTIPHDFLVIKTDLAQDALPVNSSTLTVDESRVDVVARQPAIREESSVQVPADLMAGHYVLICNLADHYSAGMHVAFTVQ